MIINLAENPKSITTSGYDVCIAGAGAAGITLAIYLGRAGKKVALLEGGDQEYTDQSMDIYKGNNTGIEYWGLERCRLRYLGGTTNHWAGRCKPLDDVDFMQRDFFGLPGWPINRSDLETFEKEAKVVLDIDKDFDAPDIPNWSSERFIPDRIARSAPTRFGTKFYDELEKSSHITLFINANLTDIRLDKDLSTVTEFVIKNYGNQDFRFSGKNFIIALGAIENARLLLNCDSQIKSGIGNHSDFVGRCFMEHFNVDLGMFAGNKKYLEAAGTTSFCTSSAFSLEHKIGNANVSMSVSTAPGVSGGRSKAVKKFVRDSICQWQTLSELSKKIRLLSLPWRWCYRYAY
ncbi:GMC family oxidoreductase [Methylocucumis oryzae]|uniref:GMC family oxidoreductase n=1 Tax=Methylocucumis oryzae TaxID=1632867 RepID=UPI000697C0C9|nr:GMC family oxidoreductase [Methylocucumis oryzae]